MARKLKTYQTSLGFFEQAIAAPSMKAALQAWGVDSNLFHQGAAKESHDPDVIAATMAKPGAVLKRPVGSDGPFEEHAGLPTDLGNTDKPAKVTRRSKARKQKKSPLRSADKAAERKAALAYEREQKRRDRKRKREEAARQKEREQRQATADKARAAFQAAEQEHAKRVAAIEAEADALEKQSKAEDARLEQERRRLDKALRRARD
jgi:hypothetical protein